MGKAKGSVTMAATALAFAPSVSPLASEVSTTLTVGAAVAYEVFADAGHSGALKVVLTR